MHEQILAVREQLLGNDHPDTQGSRNNLAMAYLEAGQVAKAIMLNEQVLADREQLLGAEHPDTVASRNNLALSYREAGRTAEAIPLYEQVSLISVGYSAPITQVF